MKKTWKQFKRSCKQVKVFHLIKFNPHKFSAILAARKAFSLRSITSGFRNSYPNLQHFFSLDFFFLKKIDLIENDNWKEKVSREQKSVGINLFNVVVYLMPCHKRLKIHLRLLKLRAKQKITTTNILRNLFEDNYWKIT